MRPRISLLSAVAMLSATIVLGAGPPRVTAWTNGLWFDGSGFRRVDVYSVGGRLMLNRPEPVTRTVDLAGGYVTGAFGEVHNHNIPGVDAEAAIRAYLENGVFYVMIQENSPQARTLLKDRINVPTSVDVVFANGAFTAPGGHPTALVRRNIAGGGMTPADLDGGFLLPVASAADVDLAWARSVRTQHPDFIKMMLVYSEDRAAGVPRPKESDRHGLDPMLAPYLVRKAHAGGWRVSAHVESAYDFDVAVASGADIIAHMPGFWPDADRIASKGLDTYRISAAAALRAARQRVVVVTTLGEALRYLSGNGEVASLREPLLAVYRHNISLLQKHGVRIVMGSDRFRGTSVSEALDIHEAGLMTAADLLRALSTDAATAIFPTRGPFGFADGAPADFLVFEGDPLASFNAVQRIVRRVKDGEPLAM